MNNLAVAAVAAWAVASAGIAAAAPVDPSAFNGPFVGIQGGWQQDRLSLRSADSFGTFGSGRRNTDGFAYGGQAGYDLRLTPSVVLGGEVAVTGKTGHDMLFDSFGNGTRERFGRTVDATGRLGAVIPSTSGLAYVRGGYSNTRILLTDPVARNGYDRGGYVVGAGYEQAVGRHVSARLEYDYSDYGREGVGATAADYGLTSSEARLHRNAVTAGLNFHF